MMPPTQAIVAVVQLATQPSGVLHQVTLRPDKVKGGLIRLGETTGDEANGWIPLTAIEVIHTLGRAEKDGEVWKCIPESDNA